MPCSRKASLKLEEAKTPTLNLAPKSRYIDVRLCHLPIERQVLYILDCGKGKTVLFPIPLSRNVHMSPSRAPIFSVAVTINLQKCLKLGDAFCFTTRE